MPGDVTAAALGQPDASGGVYLPLVARVTVGGQTWWRPTGCAWRRPPTSNHNPDLTGVLVVAADGTVTDLDEASPPTVRADESLTLQAAIADGSVESYVPPRWRDARARGVADVVVLDRGTVQPERTDDTEEPTTVLELRRVIARSRARRSTSTPSPVMDGAASTYVHRALAFGQ